MARTPDTLLDEAIRLLHHYDTGLATGAERELLALRERLDLVDSEAKLDQAEIENLREELSSLRWQMDAATEDH